MTYADTLAALLTAQGFAVDEVTYNGEHDLTGLMVTTSIASAVVYVTTFGGEVPTSAADALATLDPATGGDDVVGIDGVEVPLEGDVDDHAGLIAAAIRAQATPRYVGLWDGGSGYSSGYWATDAIAFNTLADASDWFWARLHNRPAPAARVVNWTEQGQPVAGVLDGGLQTPCVDDDATLALVPWSRARLDVLETDEHAARSHTVTVGPRGAVRVVR